MVKKTFPATVRDRGRITIDSEARYELGLEKGDYVLVTVEPMEETQ